MPILTLSRAPLVTENYRSTQDHPAPLKKGRSLLTLFLLFILSFLTLQPLMAAETLDELERPQKLNEIRQNLSDIAERKKALQQMPTEELTEEEKAELEKRIQQLNDQRRDYQSLFEQISLGGIDTTRFAITMPTEEKTPVNYNWQQEVMQILQPLFAKMQRMTEDARKKDLLREDEKELAERIELAKEGMNALQALNQESLREDAKKAVLDIQTDWNDLIKTLEHQHNIVELKLADMTDDRGFFERLTQNFWGFISNDGIILLVASAVAITLYYLLNAIAAYLIKRYEIEKRRLINFKWRLVLLAYQVVNFLLALSVFLVILHTSGNMVLFGFAVLILFALLVTFRNAIPNYIRRLRLFLNLGQAREGERIIYEGIPWEITSINLYAAYLKNPLLDNGQIRLTLDQLDKIYSRPIKMDELWFPTRAGDIILLPDQRLVKVARQTPESIYLNHEGANIVYPTAEFYKLKFSNISLGYTLTLHFTLEESPENRLKLEEIYKTMDSELREYIETQNGDLCRSIRTIELSIRQILNDTQTSYRLLVRMAPNSAKHYLEMKDLLNNATAIIARNNGWKIILTEVL